MQLPLQPELTARAAGGEPAAPMDAVDEAFQALVRANPALRVRLGNPDELRSNRMGGTPDLLKHRAVQPEAGSPNPSPAR